MDTYLTKRQAVWICRKMMKIWHPEYRGNTQMKQQYWEYFVDILRQTGRIDPSDNWSCPFK